MSPALTFARDCFANDLKALHIILLLEFLVFLPESVDSINHLLDQLDLRVAQSVLVGNVISMSGLSTRFSAGTTGLQVEFLASSLEFVNGVLGPSGEINVDRCSHTSTKIGWARVNIAVLFVKAEVLARLILDRISDHFDTVAKSLKDSLDIAAIFH